ncbi:uncharacterized protein KY384_001851 [Bacidia gigantensis]|uniref:uncharacterized protein n=1 Tax=Bacidia gigantensis TaxID=2732470 RepID=UPI001D051517|nr:uncharacterized protein KY384_001851 [Bacidia gigantensis]KAG8533068.1 hypothetical protein KY384_001851 [Bacidia gigantensis]
MQTGALRPSARYLPYVCSTCRRRAQQRTIAANGLGKYARNFQQASPAIPPDSEAREHELSNKDVEASKVPLLQLLEGRGLLNQVIGKRDELDRILNKKGNGIYLGIDPTALSLHVGHLVPLMALWWTYCYGNRAFALLGEATANIGDPSGRTSARGRRTTSQTRANHGVMKAQLAHLWEHADAALMQHQNDAWRGQKLTHRFRNNADWYDKTRFTEVLHLLAPGMRLGTQLGRDSVKLRLENGNGMSLAEFLYPMVQAWDWWHLFQAEKVSIQIGGSDQFGNIQAGADGINYIMSLPTPLLGVLRPTTDDSPCGFTTPLLTTSSGEKFGKSAGNAVWLDRNLTSPFAFYQYFVSISDDQVHKYLKLLTFKSLESLDLLMQNHNENPSKRLAQHCLAKEVTALAHGQEIAKATEAEHQGLFQPNTTSNKSVVIDYNPKGWNDVTTTVPYSLLDIAANYKILHFAGLTSTKAQSYSVGKSGGTHYASYDGVAKLTFSIFVIGGQNQRQDIEDKIMDLPHVGRCLILRTGKRNPRLLKFLPDQEFANSEFDFPHSKSWWDLPSNKIMWGHLRGNRGGEEAAETAPTKVNLGE